MSLNTQNTTSSGTDSTNIHETNRKPELWQLGKLLTTTSDNHRRIAVIWNGRQKTIVATSPEITYSKKLMWTQKMSTEQKSTLKYLEGEG